MREYRSKDELTNEIKNSFAKYIIEFQDIPEKLKDTRCDSEDRSPAENLAYQVGWTTLLLKWEHDESQGTPAQTPSEHFKWNQLKDLYGWFNQEYSHLSLEDLKAALTRNVDLICEMIDKMTEAELFEPHQRNWADSATKAAVWEVYRFIHVNTVSPFGSFRTKIRRWKKQVL